MRPTRYLICLTFLLAACGAPNRLAQAPTMAALATPAPSSAASEIELVLPAIPAYPGASTYTIQHRTAQQLSLDPTAIIGDVEVATIATFNQPLDQFRTVADFYDQTLPDYGWVLAARLGPASLYRRATTSAGQERGLYVTVRAGVSRHAVEVELAAFLARAPIAAPTHTLEHQATWQHFGGEPVTAAFGLALRDDSALFASDSRNARLLELDPDSGARSEIKSSTDQDAAGFLGIAFDPSGRLLALDAPTRQLLRFERDGQRHVLASDLPGARSLAIAADGTIYIADSTRGGLHVLSPDGTERAFWDARLRDDPETYASPEWVAVEPSGVVYVTDSANHRVKKFDASGRLLLAWGSEGRSPGRFTHPAGIAVGADGLLYVVDGFPNNRVQIFTAAGTLAGIWWPNAGWWDQSGKAQIYAARGIAIRADGLVYIADSGAAEIELLRARELPAATSTALSPQPEPQQPQPFGTLRKTPSEQEWVDAARGWLTNQPCPAPCWAGIRPGVTTVAEALAILKQHPLIDPASVAVISARGVQGTDGFNPADYPDALVWGWAGRRFTGSYGGVAFFDRAGAPLADLRSSHATGAPIGPDSALLAQVITTLRVDLSAFRADPSARLSQPTLPITLADVQAALGAPDRVLATREGSDWYTLGLIYERAGIILLEDGRRPPQLGNDWRPEALIFSDQPITDGLFGHAPALLQAWQGVQAFERYCRDPSGAAC